MSRMSNEEFARQPRGKARLLAAMLRGKQWKMGADELISTLKALKTTHNARASNEELRKCIWQFASLLQPSSEEEFAANREDYQTHRTCRALVLKNALQFPVWQAQREHQHKKGIARRDDNKVAELEDTTMETPAATEIDDDEDASMDDLATAEPVEPESQVCLFICSFVSFVMLFCQFPFFDDGDDDFPDMMFPPLICDTFDLAEQDRQERFNECMDGQFNAANESRRIAVDRLYDGRENFEHDWKGYHHVESTQDAVMIFEPVTWKIFLERKIGSGEEKNGATMNGVYYQETSRQLISLCFLFLSSSCLCVSDSETGISHHSASRSASERFFRSHRGRYVENGTSPDRTSKRHENFD